jgi:GT2 family glycosyltransferase
LIDSGVRFQGHAKGEDVGFCLNAKEKGFGVYYTDEFELLHLMEHK